jgi:hypothetical protein
MSFMSVVLVFPSVMRVGRHRLKLRHVSVCVIPLIFFLVSLLWQFSSAATKLKRIETTTTQFK